jgi:hypothetical protein
MTTIDDVREAARQLSPVEQFQLIQELLHGLQQRYVPAATLSIDPPGTEPPRVLGLHAGKLWMSDDFDAELPDEFWLGGPDELVA